MIVVQVVAFLASWSNSALRVHDATGYFFNIIAFTSAVSSHIFFLALSPVAIFLTGPSRIARTIRYLAIALALVWVHPLLDHIHPQHQEEFRYGYYVLACAYTLAMFAMMIYPGSPLNRCGFPVIQEPPPLLPKRMK